MAEPQTTPIYNTPRFKVAHYNFDLFAGPAAGEPAPDFTVTDLEGRPVRLSDFRGKWVVLETGSATCSMYVKNIPGVKDLVGEFPDVAFLVIYVREAHPGERLGQHASIEEKMAAARRLEPRYREKRRVLVDTLEGDMHRAYGVMPNVLYVIDPDGVVHFRSNWADVDALREALADRSRLHTVENMAMDKLKADVSLYTAVRTMWTGGALALWDFVVAGPALAKRHKMVDAYYTEHGKFKQQPGP